MRFGLIGLGTIGQVRRAALARTPGCSLAAVFDANRELTRTSMSDAVIFRSAEELLASDSCEAVIISTPPDSHEALAIRAFESGKHVLVEKPMASSVEASRRMVETSRRTGRTLAVGFNHRYFPAIKVVREAILSGAIGKLSYIRAYAGHLGLSEFKAPWMYSREVMGGGTLMDNGIHVLDLVCHLMRGVDHAVGATSSRIWQLEVEDNAFAILTNKNGVMGHFHSSWSEWKGYRFFVEAYGDRGMASAYLGIVAGATLFGAGTVGRGLHGGNPRNEAWSISTQGAKFPFSGAHGHGRGNVPCHFALSSKRVGSSLASITGTSTVR
jgi:predicted dehydrogenase